VLQLQPPTFHLLPQHPSGPFKKERGRDAAPLFIDASPEN
jgi:hypothetical protein